MKTRFVLFTMSILVAITSGCIDNGPGMTTMSAAESTAIPTAIPTALQDTVVPTIVQTIVPTTSIPIVTPTATVNIVYEDIPSTTPTVTIQIYNIGQSINNGNTRMTLNSIRYTKVIGDENDESNIIRAEFGNQFLIMNITIENTGQDNSLSYVGNQFTILDSDEDIETIYEEDIATSSNLPKYFNGENIPPGIKKQGEIAFQVPENVKGLKLRFEYMSESSEEVFSEFFTLDT